MIALGVKLRRLQVTTVVFFAVASQMNLVNWYLGGSWIWLVGGFFNACSAAVFCHCAGRNPYLGMHIRAWFADEEIRIGLKALKNEDWKTVRRLGQPRPGPAMGKLSPLKK